MRRFNPDKELYRIQYGNRNKIILFVFSLLVVSVISYSFALYQVRYSKRIIYTKIAPFSNKDIELAVNLDGVQQTIVPQKGEAYYDGIECDNDSNAIAHWDYNKWRLIELDVSVPNKCNINFTKNYRDPSGANPPELYQGLIPITFDSSGNVKVADTSKEWYNYDDKRWANAVLVNSENYNKYVENGTYNSNVEIPMTDILQMYVWIPRYKYQLFNAKGEFIKEQKINIKFENGIQSTGEATCEIDELGKEICNNAWNDNWYTHPAFKFGNTELPGIWIGKFETSGNADALTIKPNLQSIINTIISTMFNMTRDIELKYAVNYKLNAGEIDTHIMKHMEWGAMAYLTQSKYGRCYDNGDCEQVTKNSSEKLTGYDNTNSAWNTTNGVKASTTGNMYGIYDTAGDSWEYVMSNMVGSKGEFQIGDSGFTTEPNVKYYDKYASASPATSYLIGHLGDATRETTRGTDTFGAWYGNIRGDLGAPWTVRGGRAGEADNGAGLYAIGPKGGGIEFCISFRVALTAQDGIDEGN